MRANCDAEAIHNAIVGEESCVYTKYTYNAS